MKILNFPIQNSLSSEKFPNSPDFSRHIYSKYSYSKLSTYKCTPALCSGSVLCSTVLYIILCSVLCALCVVLLYSTVVLPGTYCMMCSGALCSGDRHNSSSAFGPHQTTCAIVVDAELPNPSTRLKNPPPLPLGGVVLAFF